MTDKTQEELEKFLDTVKIHNKDLDVCINDAVAKKWLTHYINKYYVPKGDLEDPSVSTEVGGNQVDKLSEVTRVLFDFTSQHSGEMTTTNLWHLALKYKLPEQLTDLFETNPDTTTKATSNAKLKSIRR